MKSRISALILCAVMLSSLSGCKPPADNTSSEKPSEPAFTEPVQGEIEGFYRIDPSLVEFENPHYDKVPLTKGFEALDTDTQRECYELIDEYVWYILEEPEDGVYTVHPITMYGKVLKEAELHFVISAYSMDHPEVFWLESKFSYYTTDNLTYLKLHSGLSPEETEENARTMRENIEDIFSSMESGMSPYDRELYLHDAFASRCEYADTSDSQTDKFRVYTSMGGLVDFYAVCEGYSRAMQILLSTCGVETYYVSGMGNEALHMWNTVNIDGEWYYLDVTWNDNDGTEIDYDHFNLTTEQLLYDHTISPLYWELTEEEVCGGDTKLAANFNIFVPDCETSEEGYYSRNSVEVTGFDEENLSRMAQQMVDAANNEEEAIYLYLDPDYLDFDTAVDNLFYSGDYAIFTCVEMANDELTDVKIREDYVSTTENEEQFIVTVYLEYE